MLKVAGQWQRNAAAEAARYSENHTANNNNIDAKL